VRPEQLSEAQWQRQLVELAELLGWRWYHTHDSRRSPAGFPDLVMFRERVIFVECKAERGRISAAQEDVIGRLSLANAEVHVWRPSQLEIARDVLTARAVEQRSVLLDRSPVRRRESSPAAAQRGAAGTLSGAL
jgi:hypothetical protein